MKNEATWGFFSISGNGKMNFPIFIENGKE